MADVSDSSTRDNPCQDLSFISEYVYLGSFTAATNEVVLRQHQIRRIFTVASPLETISSSARVTGVTYKHLAKNDLPNEDMLLDLPAAIIYLKEAIDAKEAVLVHCFKGISRSATVVIAYLMHAKRWSFNRTLEHVKTCRPIVSPNSGFRCQLQLFEKMAYRLDANNKEFRVYVFVKLLFRNYPGSFHQSLVDYLKRLSELEEAVKLQISETYCCRKCSKPVFTNLNVLNPIENIGLLGGCASSNFSTGPYTNEPNAICKYYIIEPLSWMLNIETGKNIFASFPASPNGSIFCPGCKDLIIGKFLFYPVLYNLCNCPKHRGLMGFLSVQIHRDYVFKQSTGKKGFFAKLFGIG